MMMRFIWLVLLLIWMPIIGYANNNFNIQLNANVARSTQLTDGVNNEFFVGTYNVKVQIFDNQRGQPVWCERRRMNINNGNINMSLDIEQNQCGDDVDWIEQLLTNALFIRITIDSIHNNENTIIYSEYIDIPITHLPFSSISHYTNRFKQFVDESIIYLDYVTHSVLINGSTNNASLAVDGKVKSDYIIGDGSRLVNINGVGFNDGYSLSSKGGVYKDVLFVNEIGNVGVHNLTPNARLHIKGDVVFQSSLKQRSYTIPSGSILLWDPSRGVFRSGRYTDSLDSSSLGKYSIGFGEDVQINGLYSSILGGENQLITNTANNSVILGGQNNTIGESYSIISGGHDHDLTGRWGIIIGGKENVINNGNYNVLISGECNFIDGEFNTIIGYGIKQDDRCLGNTIRANNSLIIGGLNQVYADETTVLGTDIINQHKGTIIYSDGTMAVASSKPYQMLIYSANGMGINRAPTVNASLTVSGNILAQQFIGDGRHLTGVVNGQDVWKQNDAGIYYLDGPVSIGHDQNKALLSVYGGITIGLAKETPPQEGTLQFDPTRGLQFYVNDEWLMVDQFDLATIFKMSATVTQNQISYQEVELYLTDLGAALGDTLTYSGVAWGTSNTVLWDDGLYGIQSPQKRIEIKNNPNILNPDFSLVVQSDESFLGTATPYPLVLGLKDSILMAPSMSALLFNIDKDPLNPQEMRVKSSLINGINLNTYGASIMIDNNVMSLMHTGSKKDNQVAALHSVLNLSPTSMYVNTAHPIATVDINGSIGFLNTLVDYHGLTGLAHKQKRVDSDPYYFYLDNDKNLAINRSQNQDIQFLIDGNRKAYFNSDKELIIGDGVARSMVSVLDGGIALNSQGAMVYSKSSAGKQSKFQSDGTENGMRLMVNENVITHISKKSIGIGANRQSNSTVYAYSDASPTIKLLSSFGSKLTLENAQGSHIIKNNDDFIIESNTGATTRYLTVNTSGGTKKMGLLTDELSNEVLVNGSLEIQNNQNSSYQMQFNNDSGDLRMIVKKEGNDLVIQKNDELPIVFYPESGTAPIMVISSNANIAINQMNVIPTISLLVNGDAKFNGPISYGPSHLTVSSFIVTSDIEEVRSVKQLIIDDGAGIGVLVPENRHMTLKSPGIYEKIEGSQGNIVTAKVSDIIEFKEGQGISINYDTTYQAIEIYNTLLDGGLILGDVTINGNLIVSTMNADGRYLNADQIPFYWQLKSNNDLYYSSGNVGINTNSPQVALDVRGTTSANQLIVSTLNAKLITAQAPIDVMSGDQVTFQTKTQGNAVFINGQSDTSLLSVKENKIGVFTDNPEADVHLFNSVGASNILLEGTNASIQWLTNDNMARVKVDGNIRSSRNIVLKVAGNDKLTMMDQSVSIGGNVSTKNSLFLDGQMSIGASFVGDASIASKLAVQNKLYVINYDTLYTSNQIQSTFYSPVLAIGDLASSLVPLSFDGVVVQDKVGVNYMDPTESLSIEGDVDLNGKLDFYREGSLVFKIGPEYMMSVGPPLNFYLSKEIDFFANNKQAITITTGSIVIGDNTTAVSDLLVNTNGYDGTLYLKSNQSTTLSLSVNGGLHQAHIMVETDGDINMKVSTSSITRVADVSIQNTKVGIQTLSPAATLDVSGNVKARFLKKGGNRIYPMPVGAIVMWSGSEANIPPGWKLCNGGSYTDKYGVVKTVPDLSNQFIRGATISNMNATGGTDTVSLTNDGAHNHSAADNHGHGFTSEGMTHTHTATIGTKAYSVDYGANTSSFTFFTSKLNVTPPNDYDEFEESDDATWHEAARETYGFFSPWLWGSFEENVKDYAGRYHGYDRNAWGEWGQLEEGGWEQYSQTTDENRCGLTNAAGHNRSSGDVEDGRFCAKETEYTMLAKGSVQASSMKHNHTVDAHGHEKTVSESTDHHSAVMPTSGTQHEHSGGGHDHSWANEIDHYVLAFIIKMTD